MVKKKQQKKGTDEEILEIVHAIVKNMATRDDISRLYWVAKPESPERKLGDEWPPVKECARGRALIPEKHHGAAREKLQASAWR
jgi:hypothetical protein